MTRPMTRGRAIRKHCQDCTYDSTARGSAVAQIHACQVESCALHPFRARSTAMTAEKLKWLRYQDTDEDNS